MICEVIIKINNDKHYYEQRWCQSLEHLCKRYEEILHNRLQKDNIKMWTRELYTDKPEYTINNTCCNKKGERILVWKRL